ncbi:MAG: CDP-diacylglycerol--glycerol-3-phosphate 3-phosphatidyltransferase [Oceanospirillaceae bacterium]|nr:CDP-diacylglycerol--glycerol-3-phosphate 3-phosphatidyltransferase [Oceanospirillaceae bacterium]
MNIPNILSLLRIALIPILVALYYLPFNWVNIACGTVFAIACFTDWLDGYIARKYDQSTTLGAFLDPVADKLIVTVALVLLCVSYATPWITIPAIIIICREIIISALREWMAELGKRSNVKVSSVGKVKTAMQMLSILILLSVDIGTVYSTVGITALYIAAILTIWSMFIYLNAAWSDLKKHS